MSAKEFWEDDPQLFESYRISFINKKKREAEELDYKSWLQGLYIYDGNKRLNSRLVQFLHNVFCKGTNKDDVGSYPKQPYSILEKQKEEDKEKNNYDNYQKALMVQGSIKQIYLEKMKNQNKKIK